MKQSSEKDYYSILGVDKTASSEEIRDAYLARTRVIHPDRFDKQNQLQDWQKANEMLTELNAAYSTLKNPNSRSEYDHSRHVRPQQQSAPPPRQSQQPPPAAFDLGDPSPSQTSYANLPPNIQARLRKRQTNNEENQFQIKLTSVVWNYIFIALLLFWFWYLFDDANGSKWKEDTLLWYTGFSLAVGYFIARNFIVILQWLKSTLKPYFYVTPIYFIKTEFDIVSYHPIWTLKDVAVTHNHKNGVYQNSDIKLKFEGHEESLSLSSKRKVEIFFQKLRVFDTKLRTAHANHDRDYFILNDDFLNLPRSGIPAAVLLSNRNRWGLYISIMALCGISMYAAAAVNENHSQKRRVFQANLPGALSDRVIQHDQEPSYPAQPLPYSGTINTFTTAERQAPLEIKASKGSHYLVKLVEANTQTPVLNVFVHSETTVKIEVPLGTYEIRYASGETWYGYDLLFGAETVYSKASKTFTFEVTDNQISGFTITLYKVAHGNLRTQSIRATDF